MARVSNQWLKERGLVQNKDGTYSKPKRRKKIDVKDLRNVESIDKDLQSITIILMGRPMPKQSARFSENGVFQPTKYKDRVKEYQRQIHDQLPRGFKIFINQVIIEEITFVFPAIKKLSKAQMEIINQGGFIPKTTSPDLPDNLKKLPLDAMSGIVYDDDRLIWKEMNTQKVYGTGGCIIIKLKGS